MDCEKCEDLLLDELYGELDDVTSAMVRKHVAGCARCKGIFDDMKDTREVVSSMPIIAVPPSLEERIFSAEREASAEAKKVVPIRGRALAFVSVAGRWAMRPQTAMAALFLLMIGSTTFLLKGRAPSHASAPITVAQEGAPVTAASAAPMEALAPNAARGAHGPLEPQPATVPPPAASAVAMDETAMKDLELSKTISAKPMARKAATPDDMLALDDKNLTATAAGSPMPTTAANAPAPPPAAQGQAPGRSAPYGGADGKGDMSNYAGGGGGSGFYTQQPSKKEADGDDFSQGMVAYQNKQYPQATQSFDRAGSRGDLNASLYAARAVRDGQGCAAAIGRFDQVAARGGGSYIGADALFDSATCSMQLGASDVARAKYQQLLAVPSHQARAQQALDSMNQVAQRSSASKSPAKPKAAAPPPASPPPQASPPAQAPNAKPAAADTNSGF